MVGERSAGLGKQVSLVGGRSASLGKQVSMVGERSAGLGKQVSLVVVLVKRVKRICSSTVEYFSRASKELFQ